jgi:hypothetical protein
MTLKLVTDFGEHTAPTAVADYFADVRFRRDGWPDLRFSKGRELADYFARQSRLAGEAFYAGARFIPEEEIIPA